MKPEKILRDSVIRELDNIAETTGAIVLISVQVDYQNNGNDAPFRLSSPGRKCFVWAHWNDSGERGGGDAKCFDGETTNEAIERGLQYLRKRAAQAMNPKTGEPNHVD